MVNAELSSSNLQMQVGIRSLTLISFIKHCTIVPRFIFLSHVCFHLCLIFIWYFSDSYIFYLVKVLCYLQSEKILVVFLQNLYMFAKNYHLHWIAGRAYIISKYIIYIFFNFQRAFCGSFPMLFPKAPTSCCKKFLN